MDILKSVVNYSPYPWKESAPRNINGLMLSTNLNVFVDLTRYHSSSSSSSFCWRGRKYWNEIFKHSTIIIDSTRLSKFDHLRSYIRKYLNIYFSSIALSKFVIVQMFGFTRNMIRGNIIKEYIYIERMIRYWYIYTFQTRSNCI